jgi:hypothetical protein
MPYCYLYQCPECQFDVEVSGAREFYTTAAGEREDYFYPPKDTYEWPVKRVSGLWSKLWCPACRAVRPYVLVELDEPAEHPVQAFFAAEAQGMTGGEVGPCPECGTEMAYEVEGELCPGCNRGRLALLGEYEP